MPDALEIKAVKQDDTKHKHKHTFEVLGVSGSVYIDKLLTEKPSIIKVVLSE